MIVQGSLGVLFGLASAFWHRDQLAGPTQLTIGVRTVAIAACVFLAAQAIVLVIQSLRTTVTPALILQAQAVISLPAVVFLLLASQPGQLRGAVTIWALMYGLLEGWMYYTRRAEKMSTDFLISGGLYVLLGVILLFGTSMGALTVFGFFGAAALISGILFIVGGATRRMRKRSNA